MKTKNWLVPIAAVCLFAAGDTFAQSAPSNLSVAHPVGFAVSNPLSKTAQLAVPSVQTVIPVRPRPLAGGGAPAPRGPDQVVQPSPGAMLDDDHQHDEGHQKLHFPGVGANGFAPPDANLAVGPNHIVQIVNVQFSVYSKTGTIFAGYPHTIGSLFSALGGGCAGAYGDPIAQYDKTADRWLISQLGGFSAPFLECIAVSQTNDPTGAYNLYSYDFTPNLNDYAKITVWPTTTNSAYLATYNLFANGANFVGADLCAYDRAAMLAGAPSPAQICFTINNDGGFLPADLDGSTLPPAGGYFLNFETLSSLRLYQLTPNFANPNSSTLSAPTDIAVASFTEACGGGTCIPQSGTTQQLDSLGDRLMYRLAYRNFGDHEAMVVNHSVTAGSSVGVRWYELRSQLPALPGAFSLYQQGTFAPDASYRWMGSAAMDHAGDIALGYSVSSSSLQPAIGYTVRIPTDPLGSMGAEVSMLAGSGSQTGGLSRWGDYTAMRIDPSDDCTFWYTNQYQPSDGSFNWATFVGSFQIVNCGAPLVLTTITVAPATASVLTGGMQVFTATGLDQFGNPVSPQPTFTWSVSGGGSISTSGLFTANSTSGGPFTVTATSGSVSGTASVTVTVLTSIRVAPATVSVQTGNTQQFNATGLDQFGNPVSPQPTFIWSVTGGLSISTSGLFTAGSTPGGPFTVTATSGSVSGAASVTVTVLTSIRVAPATASVQTGNTQQFNATGLDQFGNPVSPQPTFTWSVTGDSTISASGLLTAGSTLGGPFTVTATSGSVSGAASVTVTAPPVLTTLTVAPATALVQTGKTRQFNATGLDQFGNPVSPQPAFTWTVSGGGAISASGLFSAGSTPGGPFTVTATSGSLSGTASVNVTSPPPQESFTNSGGTTAIGSVVTINSTVASPAGPLTLNCPIIASGSCAGGSFTAAGISASFTSATYVETCQGGGTTLNCSYTFKGYISGTWTVNGLPQAITGLTQQTFGTNGAAAHGTTAFTSTYAPFYYSDSQMILRSDDLLGTNQISFGSQGSGVGQFYGAFGIALDATGRIYVADTYNCRIVRMDDMKGTNWTSYGGTCGSGAGQFSNPSGIAVNSTGKVYVADTGNSRIVSIDDMNGTNWAFYGTAGSGVGQFSSPTALAVDVSGGIYVPDTGNNRLVRIDNMTGANWTVLTQSPPVNGVSYSFQSPVAVSLDSVGGIYVADNQTFQPAVVRVDDITGANWTSLYTGAGSGLNSISVDSSGTVFTGGGGAKEVAGMAVVFASSGAIGPIGSYYVFGVTSINLPSPRPSAVSLSPASLSFSQNVGTTSAPQSVTIANFGGSPLNFGTISVSGGFAQTNTCVSPTSALLRADC